MRNLRGISPVLVLTTLTMNVRPQKLLITGEAHHCDGSPKLCSKFQMNECKRFLSAYAVNDVNSFEAYKQIGPTLDHDGSNANFFPWPMTPAIDWTACVCGHVGWLPCRTPLYQSVCGMQHCCVARSFLFNSIAAPF
ncbi:hypothetical protein ARMGADRAFT_598671 [Armillaria gallica]|uniref:Uncharacterized protein n=1 Tax=Armillaria gallica TaxID=47427 RepID=A0A2H3CPD4_ARMGA|nr:hypothetical protein ARMGADRAFT_598671 [Armillaria gallica]